MMRWWRNLLCSWLQFLFQNLNQLVVVGVNWVDFVERVWTMTMTMEWLRKVVEGDQKSVEPTESTSTVYYSIEIWKMLDPLKEPAYISCFF